MLVAVASDPQKPAVSLGSVVWSTIPAAAGQPATVAVKAEADIPDLKMHAVMTLRKNTDPSLPASHTIDLRVTFADGAEIKGIKDMRVPMMRRDDPPSQDALSGVRVKISDSYFLVGLNRGDAELAHNVDLIANRGWFDFPMLLNDDRIAKLTFEKGDRRRAHRQRRAGGAGSENRSQQRQVEDARRDEIAVFDRAERDRRAQTARIGRAGRRQRGAAQQQLLPAPQDRRAVAVDGEARQFGESRFDRLQRRCARVRRSLRRLEAGRRLGVERPDAQAAQKDDMAVAAERSPEVARQRAHIGALAAFGFEPRLVALGGDEREAMDGDRPRRDLERFAAARQIVGALAGDADRREGRRRLRDEADEARQRRFDFARRRPRVGGRDDFAPPRRRCRFRRPSARRTRRPWRRPGRSGTVLVASPNATGSTPEASGSSVPAWPTFLALNRRFNRATAWVEVTPTGLSRLIQPLISTRGGRRNCRATRRGRRRLGFDVLAHRSPSSSSSGRRSRATRGDLNSASIASWAAKVRSRSKRSSGANLRLTRWATIARSILALALSAAIVASAFLPPSGITVTVACLRSFDMRTAGTVIP